MLPSGNDAAVVLAQNLHQIILEKEKIEELDVKQLAELNSSIDNVKSI